ncbi:MAG: hypothetical protein AB7P56_04450 [Nitrososphaeraceae archaeon]
MSPCISLIVLSPSDNDISFNHLEVICKRLFSFTISNLLYASIATFSRPGSSVFLLTKNGDEM